jgi:type IV pilus assembly protein PilV
MKVDLRKQALSGRRSGGMTLIEVLVTLVIISVGLLGVAAMQLTTVRNNYDAFVRSTAAVLAADMLDRMRSNRRDALNSLYVVNYEATPTGTTIPAAEMRAWKTVLANQLPQGDGQITFDAVRRIVRIQIRWGERGEANPLEFITTSQI